MGILLVYDVTDEASFNNIRNWMRNIEQHASDNVNKVRATDSHQVHHTVPAGPIVGLLATPLCHGWRRHVPRMLTRMCPVCRS